MQEGTAAKPIFARAAMFDVAQLSDRARKWLAPGTKKMTKKFLPGGLLFDPEADLSAGFSVELVSNGDVLGLLALDLTPKADGRRPVYAGVWGDFLDSSEKVCQHTSELRLDVIED